MLTDIHVVSFIIFFFVLIVFSEFLRNMTSFIHIFNCLQLKYFHLQSLTASRWTAVLRHRSIHNWCFLFTIEIVYPLMARWCCSLWTAVQKTHLFFFDLHLIWLSSVSHIDAFLAAAFCESVPKPEVFPEVHTELTFSRATGIMFASDVATLGVAQKSLLFAQPSCGISFLLLFSSSEQFRFFHEANELESILECCGLHDVGHCFYKNIFLLCFFFEINRY